MNSKRHGLRFNDGVVFLSEQSGSAENAFKQVIVRILQYRPEVQRAYLAQVANREESMANVTLCISSTKPEDTSLLDEIDAEFARMFSVSEHLDTLFLSELQEEELRKVCSPFWDRGGPSLCGAPPT